MRIAFYSTIKPPDHPVPSGDRRMARLLIAALRSAGHAVQVASRVRAWHDGRNPRIVATIRGRAERTVGRLIDRWRGNHDRPDLWFTYHLYHKTPDWIGPPVADALDIPYVAAEASHAPKQAGGPWATGYAAAETAIRRADHLFAMSRDDADGLTRLLGQAGAHKVSLLLPFLDPGPYAAARANRIALRRQVFGDTPGPWMIAVAMMREGDKARSYQLLANTLDHLLDCRWSLAVVGDGPARPTIRGALDPTRVRFFGRRPSAELPGLMAAADLLVWPAYREAYGMALLEAQAAGTPVAAGAVGGVPDIVEDGVTGMLVPALDMAGTGREFERMFARSIGDLLADPVLRRTLGRAAADRVDNLHSLAAAAHTLDSRIRSLVP